MKRLTLSDLVNNDKIIAISLALVAIIVFSQPTYAQDPSFKPSGKIWGYMFGDVLYKEDGDTLYWGRAEYANLPKHTVGAKLRRVYFGYDYNISPKFSTGFLLEGTATTTTPGGNFGTVIKLGYLQYKDFLKVIPHAIVKVGLIPTPVFAFPEKSWGYRSVEKEALDLRGYGNSVDQGASFEGSFDKDKNGGFTVMIGNGSGNKPTISKYLEYYASVHKRFFNKKLNLEAMVDYKSEKDLPRTLLRGYISYEIPKFRFGAEISPNNIKQTVKYSNKDTIVTSKPFVISLFASTKIYKNLWVFLRYDRVDKDLNYNEDYKYSDVSQNYDEELYIAGLQWQIHDKVNIMPNLHINVYDSKTENVIERKADVVLRTTVYFIF